MQLGGTLSWAFAFWCMIGRATATDPETEALIEKLPEVSHIGYGYSAMFSGSQFLPSRDASQVHTLVLGSQPPSNSEILEQIVRRGAAAIPSLLRHLDDARVTGIPSMSGMMWMSFADEYDYNARLRSSLPARVKRDTFGEPHPPSHTITVGDLCFVALGQIANRSFNATRYQPTGGLIINSPTYSKRLCEVVRKDFAGMTERRHRELLVQDFRMPDFEERRNGATRRLAFYYPKTLEPLVLKALKAPRYHRSRIDQFLREELLSDSSPERQRANLHEFLRRNGKAYRDGLVLELFELLELQEFSPDLMEKYDVRPFLAQCGYATNVSSLERPYFNSWGINELARFIPVLSGYESKKIDKAVHGIFSQEPDAEYLAIACMHHLMGKGYDDEIRAYCKGRVLDEKYVAGELELILGKLESAKRARRSVQ